MKNKGTTGMIHKFSILPVIILAILMTAAWSCARQGSPSGGPKDESPPVVKSETPANRTLGFMAQKAEIEFNEFIALKDASKEIFVSPPMKDKPDYKVSGKKLIISFNEELKANTTYTINFGNAITDFTEGNPLVNYEYVFSTGDHIDSLSLPGRVLNAFDHKPEAGMIVMVYQDDNDTVPLDSLPLKVPPASASRSTKEGTFSINNLSAGTYMVFALEDLNNNFIFDLPNERVAFLDSLVTLTAPETAPVVNPDSADSTAMMPENISFSQESYTLMVFQEEPEFQKMLGKKTAGKNLLQYYFQQPIDTIFLAPLDFEPGLPDWYMTEFSKNRDTVNFWIKAGMPDTIRVIANYSDSLSDTVRMVPPRLSADPKGRRKDTGSGKLGISTNVYAGAFDLHQPMKLSFSAPVVQTQPGRIILEGPADTLSPRLVFQDSLRRTAHVEHAWGPGEYFHLIINDSSFTDLSGLTNDSISVKFKVRTPEDYGLLVVNALLPTMQGQAILQLLTDKDVLVSEKIIRASGPVRFSDLMPGNYKIKFVSDDNSNGKWDSGNYRKKILPERTLFYPTTLVIRANWDRQEDWRIE